MRSNFSVFIVISLLFMCSCKRIKTVTVTYGNRAHFKISTNSATYYYDKAGGGFSSIIDVEGVDWVQFNGNANVEYPEGAASGFRGVPNLVYRSKDGGAGHPGFDQCVSERIDDRTILTKTKSGKWQWRWTFYDDYARMTMEQTDSDHGYWFLYEGPVGGTFNPSRQYWGTDKEGPRFETPSLNMGEHVAGNWQWAYFGDTTVNRVFFVAQEQPDTLIDYFAYMGSTNEGNNAPDGMVVFGFGRAKGAQTLMNDRNAFIIGFFDEKIITNERHKQVGDKMKIFLNAHE